VCRCQMGLGMGRGVSPLQPTRGLGEHRELPSRVQGRAPAENRFWCTSILKATKRSFLYLYDGNLRETICISVPFSKFWGDLSPASPVIYAHGHRPLTNDPPAAPNQCPSTPDPMTTADFAN